MAVLERIREYLQTRFTRADAARLVSSLILATMLWGYVSLITDPEETQSFANLELQPIDDLDDDLILTSVPPDITVRLTGPESVLEDIGPNEIQVSLDLDELDGPDPSYQARVRIDSPDGVRRSVADPEFVDVAVSELVPEPINFTLVPEIVDPRESVSFRVEAQPDVSVVRVSGAVEIVERIAAVQLPVELGDRVDSFRESFAPVALDAAGNPVPEAIIEPSTVPTDVTIDQRGRSVPVLVRVSGSQADGYTTGEQRVLPQSVVLDGPDDVLESIFYVNTVPVDIAGATETVTRTAAIDVESLPDTVSVLTPTSGEVEVIIQISPVSSAPQPLSGQSVQIVGVSPGLTAVAVPSEISVVVETSTEQIERLQPGDIVVSADISGLGVGTHVVRPSVSVPPEMSWIRTDPESVTITVTEADAFNGDTVPGLGGTAPSSDEGVSPEASPVQSPTP